MNLESVRLWIAGLTGVALVGEAVALYVGMSGGGVGASAWLSTNQLFLLGDVIFGIVMIAASLRPGDQRLTVTLYVAALYVLLTHLLRTFQYLSGRPDPFAFNPALFWVNNLKAVGALLVIVLRR